MKNSAYAWRQMVFFLSLVPLSEQDAFLCWAEQTLRAQPPEFVELFTPALLRLRARMEGDPEATAGHMFLGWTTGRHWLMPVKRVEASPVEASPVEDEEDW